MNRFGEAVRKIGRVLALAAFLGAPVMSAHADPAAASVSAQVNVELVVIEANNEGTAVDEKLTPFLQSLKSLPYSHFTLLDQQQVKLKDGTEQTLTLVQGRKMHVHLLSHDDQRAKVQIRLYSAAELLLETNISIDRNRSFYLAVRGEGINGALVIPVSVFY